MTLRWASGVATRSEVTPSACPSDCTGGTLRSLAVIALSTGAPVVPASSWRESAGQHVLRFESPLLAVEHADVNEAIRLSTRAFNQALERLIVRRPEQWWWVHRRWKPWPARRQ